MKKYFKFLAFVLPLITLVNYGSCGPEMHLLTFVGDNCNIEGKDFYTTRVEHNKSVSLQISADYHYSLPKSVELYEPQTGAPDYNYDYKTGVLTIDKMSAGIKLKASSIFQPIYHIFAIASEHFKVEDAIGYTYWQDIDDRDTVDINLVADYGYYLPESKSDFNVLHGSLDMFDYQYHGARATLTLNKIQDNLVLTSGADQVLYKVDFDGNDFCYINRQTIYEEDALKGVPLKYVITCDEEYNLPTSIEILPNDVPYTYDNKTGLLTIKAMPASDLHITVKEDPIKKPVDVGFVGIDCTAKTTGIEPTDNIHLKKQLGETVTLELASINDDYLLPTDIYFTIDDAYADPTEDYIYKLSDDAKTAELTFKIKGVTEIKVEAYEPPPTNKFTVAFEGVRCKGRAAGSGNEFLASFTYEAIPGATASIEIKADDDYHFADEAKDPLNTIYVNGVRTYPTRYAGFDKAGLVAFSATGNAIVSITAGHQVKFDSGTGELIPPNYVEHNGYTTPPKIEREGYELTGWYLDEEHTKLFNFEQMFITEDILLYAGWAQSLVRVSFLNRGVQFYDKDGQVIHHLYVEPGEDVILTIKTAGKNGDVFALPSFEQISVYGSGYSSCELTTDYYTYDKITIKDISEDIIVEANAPLIHPEYTIDDYSWEQISYISKGNMAHEVFNIGDTKKLTVSSNPDHVARIIGFNHDDLAGVDGVKAGITFELSNVICNQVPLDLKYWYDDVDAKDFPTSLINIDLQKGGSVYDKFPDEILDIVSPVKKKVHVDNEATNNLASFNASFFLLSTSEIGVDKTPEALKEGNPYEYYVINSELKDRIKKETNSPYTPHQYWLRSPNSNDYAKAWTIDTQGNLVENTVNRDNKQSIAPAFCI